MVTRKIPGIEANGSVEDGDEGNQEPMPQSKSKSKGPSYQSPSRHNPDRMEIEKKKRGNGGHPYHGNQWQHQHQSFPAISSNHSCRHRRPSASPSPRRRKDKCRRRRRRSSSRRRKRSHSHDDREATRYAHSTYERRAGRRRSRQDMSGSSMSSAERSNAAAAALFSSSSSFSGSSSYSPSEFSSSSDISQFMAEIRLPSIVCSPHRSSSTRRKIMQFHPSPCPRQHQFSHHKGGHRSRRRPDENHADENQRHPYYSTENASTKNSRKEGSRKSRQKKHGNAEEEEVVGGQDDRGELSLTATLQSSLGEDDAAVRIQKIGRGFISKKKVKAVEKGRLAKVVLEDLIDDLMVTEFIPDLLIEVILHQGNEFGALPPEDQGIKDALQSIIKEVVEAFARLIVEKEIMDFIHGFLHRRKQRYDPLRLLVEELLAEAAVGHIKEVAEEAILVCTYGYLEQRRALEIYEEFSTQVISTYAQEVAQVTLLEESITSVGQEIIQEVIDAFLKQVGQGLLKEMIQEERDIQYKKDLNAVAEIADQVILKKLISKCLLGVVGKRGEDLVLRQFEDIILLQMMTSRLLGLTQEIHQRTHEVSQCRPIEALFETLVIKQGFPFLLHELSDELTRYEDMIDKKEDDAAAAAAAQSL